MGVIHFWIFLSANGQHPIAEIKNANYSAVESLLGGSSAIDAFSNRTNPGKADIDNFLAPVKLNLTSSQIASYTYEPGVGMVSSTDAKGSTTYFEYDGVQRLQNVKNRNGDIVKNYRYNYAAYVDTSPAWTDKNVKICATSGGVNTGNELMQQIDSNPNSPTYNTYRTRSLGNNGNCTSSTVYARVSYENENRTALRTRADIVVRFFSDPYCTAPLSVSGLTIPYEVYDDLYSPMYTSSATGSGTSVMLESQSIIREYDQEWDVFPIVQYFYYLGTSPNYIIVN